MKGLASPQVFIYFTLKIKNMKKEDRDYSYLFQTEINEKKVILWMLVILVVFLCAVCAVHKNQSKDSIKIESKY
jgi:hypothetical protein